MITEKVRKAISYLENANSVALVSHVNPDGDTVGSALALFAALEKLGKEVGLFCDDFPPKKLSCLQNVEKYNVSVRKKFDLAVAIDCGDIARTGVSGKYFKHAKSTLVIDHHKTGQPFTDYQLCDTTASATAEIMYEVITGLEEVYRKPIMDEVIAEALFLAMVTDTGAFGFSNVTGKTHAVAGALLKFDFDQANIIYDMVYSKSKSVFLLTQRVLGKTRFFLDDRLAIITFTDGDFEATGTSGTDTEGIITNLINISEVMVAVALTEDRGKHYKVSFRTKEPIDAADCAAEFGGGGHSRAAGCRISGYYEDVIDKLVKVAGDRL